jgi:hypothetical protein
MLARLIAMEAEALDAFVAANMAGRTGIDAIPHIFYEQNSFPYIVHRVGPGLPEPFSEDANLRVFDVFIRVVIGHYTSNYDGDNEELIDEIIPLLVDYFEKHEMLTTDSGTNHTEPTYLHPDGMEIGASSGIVAFSLGGVGSTHIGEELGLTVPVILTRESS